jgi:hypothetical protein
MSKHSNSHIVRPFPYPYPCPYPYPFPQPYPYPFPPKGGCFPKGPVRF